MACPNCDSKNCVTQKYDPAEIEEITGVQLMQIMVLCKDCKWGFNCAGTLDTRPKKERTVTPV